LLAYFLITLLPIAGVIYVVWAHRKRSTERVAASSKRFSEIFGSVPQSAAVSPPVSAAPGARYSPASWVKKETLLKPQHASLFRALGSSLPEYEMFVHVSLAAVIEPPPAVHGREREQRLRVLAQNTVDCLVCDKAMTVIAAIDVEDGDSAESRIKSEYLKAAQVCYLRINPSAFPGRDEIRARLLGTPANNVPYSNSMGG
jgi:hypothetical protein